MADDHAASSQICSIKMDINCCQKCPLKLERKLLKSNGVESVTIDQDKGLVTVTGDIDPVALLQKIKAMGKEAKLWFFQQESNCSEKTTGRSRSGSNIKHGGIGSDSITENETRFDWHLATGMKEHDRGFQSLPTMSSDVNGCSYPRSLSPAMSSNVHAYSYPQSLARLGYRPMWPYQQSVPRHRLTPHGYYLQPHPPPAYRHFQPRSPPRANPMVHYTDYADNYRL
ncbi:Heavy metal-associated isoprenylated plant protein 42, partial [Cucurbita argyrosperma subsp. sororia]